MNGTQIVDPASLQRLVDGLTCDVLKCGTRADWLAARPRLGVGASQTAALFGCGFDSQYSAWAKVTDPATFRELAEDEAERMFWGRRMEPVIIEEYLEQSGIGGVAWPQTDICVAKHFRGFCTPDAIFYDTEGPIIGEIKAYSEYARKEWADGPPVYILVQVQMQMEVTGVRRSRIVVLFGNSLRNLRVFDIAYDEAFAAAIRERVGKFNDYVDNRIEPPVDESEMTAEALAKLHPDDSGDAIDLPDDADGWALERAGLKETLKTGETRLKWLDNNLKAAIGDATYGGTPGGRWFSWKTQGGRTTVDGSVLVDAINAACDDLAKLGKRLSVAEYRVLDEVTDRLAFAIEDSTTTTAKFRVLRTCKGPK